MENKKYKLTDETIEVNGHTLYRIQALKNIEPDVKKGDFGGFVESEDNLSHDGGCWIHDNACAYEDSSVEHTAHLLNRSMVFENAKIQGHAMIIGNAHIRGDALVKDDAVVADNAEVWGRAIVFDNSTVSGNSTVTGFPRIFGHLKFLGMRL